MPRARALSAVFALFLVTTTACSLDLDSSAPSNVATSSEALTGGRIRITYGEGGPTIQHGYDIKQPVPNKAAQLTSNAALRSELFGTDDSSYHFNLLRVPILAVAGHPEIGRVDANAYADYIAAIKAVQRVNPNVKVFASLRSENETKIFFPAWTMKGSELDPHLYGRLLMDYAKHFREEGVTIDFLGPDNEPQHHVDYGKIDAAKFRDIVDDLRERYSRNALPMPQIVGNCDTSAANGRDFMNALFALGKPAWSDLDGVSFHYNPLFNDRARADDMKVIDSWMTAARDRPRWSTEFHWNELHEDFSDLTHGGIGFLDQFAMGMSESVWWAFMPLNENLDQTKAHIEGAFVRATVHAHVLATDDHDGARLDYGTFNSMAFRQDDDVTLIVINDSGTPEANKWVEIPGTTFKSVTGTQWTRLDSLAGKAIAATPVQAGVFKADFPAHSITVLRIPHVTRL